MKNGIFANHARNAKKLSKAIDHPKIKHVTPRVPLLYASAARAINHNIRTKTVKIIFNTGPVVGCGC